ncbi:MAG: mechanosensitive ion channel family protein, partial [Bdellovibrionales bacterium]|nr:mechanosensitive ion channel family protein [Bdellovibrionales bacterium]
QWGIPIGLIVAPILLRPILSALTSRLAQALHSKSLEKIAPAISWLSFPLCLYWAASLAPLPQNWTLTLRSIAYIGGVLVLMAALRKLALYSTEWALRRVASTQNFSSGFVPILRNLVTLVTFILGTILVLQHFGYNVWSLITALGVGSLAVGLAAKDTLSHMISGFVLIIDRNLRPGDRVSFSGAIGTVEEIGLRSTRIITSNGNSWIVPNSELVNTKILNFSLPAPTTKVQTSFRVSLETPLELVRKTGTEILHLVQGVEARRGLDVRVLSLMDGVQTLELSFWASENSAEGQSRMLSDFLEAFARVSPSRSIKIHGATPTPEATLN